MKKVLNAIDTALGKSNTPGVISVRRFSTTRFSIKRFSEAGDVISSDLIEDEDAAGQGTETIIEQLPDSSEAAVFSDGEEMVDEVVATVDGGSIDPEVETAITEGYTEEAAPTASMSEVCEQCGVAMPDVIANSSPEVQKAFCDAMTQVAANCNPNSPVGEGSFNAGATA